MAENTSISYATHTWSPWIGCTKVASGCANCYAEADFDHRRKRVKWGANGTRSKTSDTYWRKPLAWDLQRNDRQAWLSTYGSTDAEPVRVFPSLCDVFEKWDGPVLDHRGHTLWLNHADGEMFTTDESKMIDPSVSELRYLTMDDLRRDMFELIDQTDNLDWLLLTKRPENIHRMMTAWAQDRSGAGKEFPDNAWKSLFPMHNTWLIYSASDQESLDAGLPHLLECRDLSPVLGLSLEPLLGPIDLPKQWLGEELHVFCEECTSTPVNWLPTCNGHDGGGIDWVVIGGESGRNARPCNVEWIRDIVEQCKAADVPCFIKQDSGPKSGQQGRIQDDIWNVKEFPRKG